MSDTTKDKPWWVLSTWWEPEHRHCPHDARTGRWWPPLRGARRVCDLPPAPVVQRPPTITRSTGCIWWPVDRRHPFTSPPKWFRDHRWANPQRVAVRDLGRRAAAEYRAGGPVDVELPATQHRHGARWDWE